MGLKVTNNAFGVLNASINSSATTIVLVAGQGARFPTLSAGDYFYATLIDTSNNLEIVKCTARSTDTLTVERAQDSTTARAYATNDRFELRPTAALFNEKANDADVTTALAGKQAASSALTTYASTGVGMRNRIINPGMVIDQRNAGAAVTVNGVGIFSVDRWACVARATGGGVYSAQQVSDAPTGFSNSLKFTVTTVDTSLGTLDYYFAWQKIEGFNTADLSFGTASAKTVTLSFWVKSSITGQFSAFLTNSSEVYSQPSAYTVNAANTWEFKTLTFTGATAGTWIGATNGVGLIAGFGLANGTSLQGTSGVWTASSVYGSTGDVNWMATNGNTWQVTGVQLEVGTVATPFEHRQYGTELFLCQRYYINANYATTGSTLGMTGNITNGINYHFSFSYLVPMRASPTLTWVEWTSSGFPASSALFQQTGYLGSNVYKGATSTTSGGYFLGGYTASAEL